MPDTPNIDFTIRPAGMVSVPIDTTLSIAGQAADAKAVGDALALKADKSEIAASIKVNGQGADLQGEIIVTAEHVPMDDNETSTVAEEIEALQGRTAEDIPVNSESGAATIAEALAAASAGAVVSGNVAAMAGSVADGSRAVEAMEIDGARLPVKDAGAVRSVNGERPDTSGNVEITHVETAHNLTADDAQSNVARFVIRTTGGDTPVADGAAWLAEIRGAFEHTGVVEEQLTMTVRPATRPEGVAPITASLDAAAFKAAVDESSTITLAYTGGDWDTAPDTLGITVNGTPVNGDEIAVVYVKADRGLITPATPTALRATGWNLYNHTAGYARVVKYSDAYGFRVEGSYTGLTYSETENGERTTITPVNGAFDVPGDGYVWVAGGDGTSTTVYMTWSDWTGGHGGSFEAYAESVIDLSGLVEDYFPNGMMAVGGVADTISLDMQTLTVAIERLTYSEETIAQLDAAGRPWEADSDYIYTAKEKPVTVTGIGVASRYTVSDHGMEIISGTEVAPQILALYGQNLRDKLRMNVLTIGQQSLSSAQKAQVQTNLSVPSTSEMEGAIQQSTADKAKSIKLVSDSVYTDFDDLWQNGNGIFSIRTSSTNQSAPVPQSDAYWYVFQATIYANNGYGIQIATRSTNNYNVYMRKRINGTNYSWIKITFENIT